MANGTTTGSGRGASSPEPDATPTMIAIAAAAIDNRIHGCSRVRATQKLPRPGDPFWEYASSLLSAQPAQAIQ
jgi:hypothetical protein